MRSAELSIKHSNLPILGRLESVSYPHIGKMIYNFYGGPVSANPSENDKFWEAFSVERSYSLGDGSDDFINADIDIGDIVQFNPSGASVLVYERSSKSNALFLTQRCNSSCLMCPQPPQTHGDYVDLSIATAQLIKDEIATIGITGGEPTIAWNGLIQLLLVLNICHPNCRIELLTNGRKFHQYHKARQLSETNSHNIIACIPLYSDIASIHDAIVCVKGAFWQTVEGIYNLERFEIPVELRIVVLKQNFERLNPWAKFVYRHFPFVKHVAIMGLEPIGYAQDNIDTVWIDPVDYSEVLLCAVKTLKRQGMRVSIYNHQLCTMPKSLWGYSKRSISEWKNSFLNECANCTVQKMCGGFFDSAAFKHSRGIAPVIT